MLRFLYKAFLFCTCVLVSATAHASDIAVCGESLGYSFYADRGLRTQENIGWTEDSVLQGRFTLTKDKNKNFDILIADATGAVFSSVSDGAKVLPVIISNDSVTVLVVYPKLVGTYIFQKLNSGKYQAMYTEAKAETTVPKISAFVADCSYLNLATLNQ